MKAFVNAADLASRLGDTELRREEGERGFAKCRKQNSPRMGLALSAGAARGLSHIGVIQVLEENHIPIDAVAGCSMGAYIGAVWACGYYGYEMETLAHEIENYWGLFKLLDPVFPPWRGLVRGRTLLEHLKRSIGEVRFDELTRPLKVVATEAVTGRRAVFEKGKVAEAVLASSAIPGIIVPVEVDGRSYLDGGLSDPLPVDVLREMGVESVIAVNALPSSELPEGASKSDRGPGDPVERNPWKHPEACESGSARHSGRHRWWDYLIQIFVRANASHMAAAAGRRAHLVLRPAVCHGRWHEFSHADKFIASGREAAEEELDTIRSLTREGIRTGIKKGGL